MALTNLLRNTCFMRWFYFGDPRSQKQQSGQAKPTNKHDQLVVGFIKAVAVICWALNLGCIENKPPSDVVFPQMPVRVRRSADKCSSWAKDGPERACSCPTRCSTFHTHTQRASRNIEKYKLWTRDPFIHSFSALLTPKRCLGRVRCSCRPDYDTFASSTEMHLPGQNPVNKRDTQTHTHSKLPATSKSTTEQPCGNSWFLSKKGCKTCRGLGKIAAAMCNLPLFERATQLGSIRTGSWQLHSPEL